jgi:hypothetical protein
MHSSGHICGPSSAAPEPPQYGGGPGAASAPPVEHAPDGPCPPLQGGARRTGGRASANAVGVDMSTGLDGASTSQPRASTGAACTQELAPGNKPPELVLEEPQQRSPGCTSEADDDLALTSPSGDACAGPALASPPQTPQRVIRHRPVIIQNLSPVKNLMRVVQRPSALHA